MARRPRRRHRRGLLAAVLVPLLGLAAVAGVVVWLRADHPTPLVATCTATIDGSTWNLDPDQADNAALVAGVAVRRGLPARAVTIALATALQESRLRNVTYGDRDSLGLFQQRPSQGWGTAEQVQDPVYATGIFYDRLVKVASWQTIEVAAAAQAVQHSAYPQAYAQHEPGARAFASALTGWSPAALSCTLDRTVRPTDPTTGARDALAARVIRDLGGPTVSAADQHGVVTLDARSLGDAADADRLGWAVGQWAVASASTQQVTAVQVDDQVWTRGAVGWRHAGSTVVAGTVAVTLAG